MTLESRDDSAWINGTGLATQYVLDLTFLNVLVLISGEETTLPSSPGKMEKVKLVNSSYNQEGQFWNIPTYQNLS